MCAQTHGCAYVQPHTPTHPYVYTPMYAHVRTYTRTRRKFSDIKSALQHCQTEFNHQSDTIQFYHPIAVQSISILAPHWLRYLYKLSLSLIHYHPFRTITQPFAIHLSFISHCHLISLHHLTHIIFHLYLISNSTHHPINMSVCYKTLLILYISAALPICFLIYNRFLLHQPTL